MSSEIVRGERLSGGGRAIHEVEPLPPLRIERLTKTYRDPLTLKPFVAVEDVSFSLERGEIFGLLGPNGAGKTTTIKLMLGLARPTSGLVRLEGRDPRDPRARRRLGYLAESPCFYDHLTATEYLELCGDLFGIEPGIRRRRAGALLERLGLTAHARKPLRKFSKGMTQRLGLAQALLNEPTLLVLDEPMSGLDPIGRAEVKEMLREERARGATVLLSSHVLAETETICDRVGILSGGKLLETGTVPELVQTGVREWEIVLGVPSAEGVTALRSEGLEVETVGAHAVIRVTDGSKLQRVLAHLTGHGVPIHAVEPRRETLEEHFVNALRRVEREPRASAESQTRETGGSRAGGGRP
jgi:ABC-2 type transport system ATP-binding protein